MARLQHSGGLVEVILELGFDQVKYFELSANGVAQSITMNPPARRLTLRNTADAGTPIYFNVTGDDATTVVSAVPGDNIKIDGGCVFELDFDSLSNISFITEGPTVTIEGHLGWKGTGGC